MRLLKRHWIILALILFVALLGAYTMGQKTERAETLSALKETTLDHIKKTKKIRCAYWLWPELVERNPNTGRMSGVYVDVINRVAKALGADVEWKTEATIDNIVALITSGKVDAICGPLVPAAHYRAVVGFASPILYAGYDIYVRPDDNRFINDKTLLNKKSVTLLSVDGSASGYYSQLFFPKAKQKSLPSVLGAGQVLLDVQNGKSDATVAEQLTAERYIDNNPGSLKLLRWGEAPLLTLGITPFVTKVDDLVFLNTLNAILRDLLDFGEIEQIYKKHGLVEGRHYNAISLPYVTKP